MGLVINLKINNAPSGSRPSEPMSPDFTEWLTRNPQPALHDLVQRYGGYHRVPADAWAQFDLDIADWQARRIRRLKWT
jgi:hypothetical protein